MRDNEDEHIVYDSFYPAQVVDNKDPLMLGRIRCIVPSIAEDIETEWLFPSMDSSGPGSGWYDPPPENAGVWVVFQEGDPETGLYLGGYWSAPGEVSEVPTEFQRKDPTNRGYKSPGGHLLEFDDLEDSQGVRVTSYGGFKIHIDDKNQKAFIETPGGHKLEMDDVAKLMTLTVTDDYLINTAGNKDENISKAWTVNVTDDATINCTNAKVEASADADVIAGGNVNLTATGKIVETATQIELNGAVSGITTYNSHFGVVDFITGVQPVPSPTVKGDV